MAAATENISGFRLALAIGAAIVAVLLRTTAATRMGALLYRFHTLLSAFRLPELLSLPNSRRRGSQSLASQLHHRWQENNHAPFFECDHLGCCFDHPSSARAIDHAR